MTLQQLINGNSNTLLPLISSVFCSSSSSSSTFFALAREAESRKFTTHELARRRPCDVNFVDNCTQTAHTQHSHRTHDTHKQTWHKLTWSQVFLVLACWILPEIQLLQDENHKFVLSRRHCEVLLVPRYCSVEAVSRKTMLAQTQHRHSTGTAHTHTHHIHT